MKQLAAILPDSQGDAVYGLNLLLRRLGVKRALIDFGFKEEDIGRAADLAMKNSYYNPRKIERETIRELIRRACVGEDARADL